MVQVGVNQGSSNNVLISMAFVLAASPGRGRNQKQKMKGRLKLSIPGFTERAIPNALPAVDYGSHFQCLTELI